MECTQRLESTQEFCETETKPICPEQIGFLGICGTKYPVIRGPNKIGRDGQMCSIVLQLDSVSRTHAVINILHGKEYMLMDLDSANKTRLNNVSDDRQKILQPYIPYPLNNYDTVQFGDVFGVFRLLKDENDLPMTQAIDIPDTPVPNRHGSRLNKCGVTTIPESPEVSDRDDSFIMPTQPKGNQSLKSTNTKFIKQTAKTISIQPVGSHQIDNVFWSSSKKSLSFNDSGSNDDSTANTTHQNNGIHEMETQPPFLDKTLEDKHSIHSADTQLPYGSRNSIYTAETQLPSDDRDSIHSAATQLPENSSFSSIHSLDTQMPDLRNMPTGKTVSGQCEMQFDLRAASKDNAGIHNAETQAFAENNSSAISKSEKNEEQDIFAAVTQYPFDKLDSQDVSGNDEMFQTVFEKTDSVESEDCNRTTSEKPVESNQLKQNTNAKSVDNSVSKSTDKINTTFDEEILFDEEDGRSFEEDFYSQPILTSDLEFKDEEPEIPLSQTKLISEQNVECAKKEILPESDKALESEDITMLPTQKIPALPANLVNDEDLTDCEEDIENKANNNCVSSPVPTKNPDSPSIPFDEMATQVLEEEKIVKKQSDEPDKIADNVAVEDTETPFDEMATQVLEEDEIILQLGNKTTKNTTSTLPDEIISNEDFGEKATQIIQEQEDLNFENLSTQVLHSDNSPEITNELIDQPDEQVISLFKKPLLTPLKNKKRDSSSPIVGNVLMKQHKNIPPPKLIQSPIVIDDEDGNYYEATQDILNDLNTQQFEASPEIVHISTKPERSQMNLTKTESNAEETLQKNDNSEDGKLVAPLKRVGSDISDVEVTPKKVRSFKLMHTQLPDSQEIKTSVSLATRISAVESSSESEVEQNSEEMTPIVFRKKQRKKKSETDAKIDLLKKFEALPTRIITRVRKPTAKIQESNILKPIFMTTQDEDVDNDIITENIIRLKSKNGKKNNTTSSNVSEPKNTVKTEKKTEKINNKVVENNDVLPKNTGKIHKTDPKVKEEPEIAEKKSKTKSRKSKEECSVKTCEKENEDSVEKNARKTGSCRRKPSADPEVNKTVSPENLKYKANEKRVTRKQANDSKIVQENIAPIDKKTKSATIDLTNTESIQDKKRDRSTKNAAKETRKAQPDAKKESKSKSKPKSKSNNKTKDDTALDQGVRRSKRQKAVNKNETIDKYLVDTNTPVPKSDKIVTLSAHDLSTVYSISSSSGSDNTPIALKRSATSLTEAPYPKRARSLSKGNISLRATPARQLRTQHVLFTAFNDEEVKKKLEKMGALLVTDVKSCTVVLTMSIKRTFKLLCAVGLGIPIVGPEWVQACSDTNMIVDPWQYLLKDAPCEQRFQFSLQRTLAGKRGFLKGYHVSSTPKVLPNPPEMKLIVECSGGTWQASGPKWVCVSCLSDKALWPELKMKGAIIVSSEFILSGVLRQVADIERNRLDLADMA